jgi:hypothetical protein
MPTGFNWTSYQAALVTQIPSLVTDPNFITILPACIDYAELSIARDLDLFSARGLLDLGALTIGTPTLTVSNSIIVAEQLFYIAPAGGRVPITPMSDAALNAIYGTATPGPPLAWTFMPMTQLPTTTLFPPIVTVQPVVQQIEVGPSPDAAYDIQCMGLLRPLTLSAANPTTYISLNYPDLFWAASMIFLAGYNRNFGAQSDDPRQALSWESEYSRLLKSALVEEERKKMRGPAWTASSPSPLATPPRK